MVANENTELRKLRPAELYNLALILNTSNNWKKLMGSVTKDECEGSFKFSSECALIIEQASCQERKPAAAIFLEEWATMGKKRPTLGFLLKLLMKLELFRAADYLAEEILKVQAPSRPNFGPAVAIDAEEVLGQLLRKQHLQSQTDCKNSNIHRGIPSEIHLSQINYPMNILEDTSVSDNNFTSGDNDVGVIEMHYDQPESHEGLNNEQCSKNYNLVPDTKNNRSNLTSESLEIMNNNVHDAMNKAQMINRTNTDLIKFSVSNDFEKSHHHRHTEIDCGSDLIKFSHTSLNNENSSENSLIGVARRASSPKSTENDENLASSKYFHRELMSAELPLCINERNGLNSNALNSPVESLSNDVAQTLESDLSKTSENSIINEVSLKTDFPRSVAEVGSKERIFEQAKSFFEYPGVNNAMNSEELPVMVLDFQKQ